MGKTTGFLDYARKNNTDVPVSERIQTRRGKDRRADA